jgi:hypothetical protein
VIAVLILACTFEPPTEHEIDRLEQEVDTIAPAVPVITEVTITRGTGHGCGETRMECDELGIIEIAIESNDDRTPVDKIGWHIELTGESIPPITINPYDIEQNPIILSWADGAYDEQEPLDFNIRIIAVDLAGNVSSSGINVPIMHGGDDGGCGCRPGARHRVHGQYAAIVLAVVVLTARRWRRRGR